MSREDNTLRSELPPNRSLKQGQIPDDNQEDIGDRQWDIGTQRKLEGPAHTPVSNEVTFVQIAFSPREMEAMKLEIHKAVVQQAATRLVEFIYGRMRDSFK